MTLPDATKVALDKQAPVTSLIPELVVNLERLEAQILQISPGYSMTGTIRSLALIDILSRWKLTAIAGVQGVGKTELALALLPSADSWLKPVLGQGERMPVALVHRSSVSAATASIYRQAQGGHRREAITDETAWELAVRGQDETTLLCLLELPIADGWTEGQGLLLLPGFEREDTAGPGTSWQEWMREALTLLGSCLVVTGKEELALAGETVIATLLAQSSIERQVVVVRWDSPPELPAVMKRAAEVYDVPPSSVFALDRPEKLILDRPEQLGKIRTALQESLARSARASTLTPQTGKRLRELLVGAVKQHLDEAATKFEETPPDGVGAVQTYRKAFQERRNSVVKVLGYRLPRALEAYAQEREPALVERLDRTRLDAMLATLTGRGPLSAKAALQLRQLCESVCPPADVRAICDDIIATVADQEGQAIRFLNVFGDVQETLLNLTRRETDGLALTATARALPFLALNAQRLTRTADQQGARPTVGHAVPAGALSGFEAFGVFLWPDQAVQASPRQEKSGPSDLSWIAVALSAAKGGLAAVLLSSIAPQAIGVIKKVGWNRTGAARDLIHAYMHSVTEATLASVEQLMDFTYTSFDSLYRQAAHLDAQADRSLHHTTALNRARDVQKRMLVVASWR